MDRNLFIGYLIILGLGLAVINIESLTYKICLFIPLIMSILAWVGYYIDYKERHDK